MRCRKKFVRVKEEIAKILSLGLDKQELHHKAQMAMIKDILLIFLNLLLTSYMTHVGTNMMYIAKFCNYYFLIQWE